MTRMRLLGLGAAALVCVGGVAVALPSRGAGPALMIAVDPAKVTFEPAPIRKEWLIEGHPVTVAAEVAHTADESTHVYIWKTSAAHFRWYYEADELITVLDGEVFISDDSGPEHRLGPGAVAFFPAGAVTTWRVPDHLSKVATLRRPLPWPIAGVVGAMRGVKHYLYPTGTAFAAE